MSGKQPRLFCGFESLRPGNGGICRVARLLTRLVGDEVPAGRLAANGVVLSDDAPPTDAPFPVVACGKSRRRFVTAVAAATVTHSHFVYDCGGMARAHGWLPLPRRPYLTFVHGIESWPGSAHLRQVAAIARADVLVCITDYTRERAAAGDPRLARAERCWLATEEDDPPPPAPKCGPPRVTIVSRIDKLHYKGHAELIAAWPAVRAAVPDAVLTVVGSGPGVAHYQRQVGAAGLTDRQVEFRGFVSDAELQRIWADTSVFAMPSRGEGFGLVYIEAMRHGVPVIASVHDAGREVNVDAETGYNVSLDRSDELTDRLIHLLRHPDHAASLGANGRTRWHQHFRYSCFRDRFKPILNDLLSR